MVNNASNSDSSVIVIGVHRSGTTAIAEVLRRLGVRLGNRLEENLEDRTVKRINEWILRRAGGAWDNPGPVKYVWRNEAIRDRLQNQLMPTLEARIVRRLSATPAWAVKDPRFCVTLPLWRSMVQRARFIQLQRDGRDVALSLHTRATKRLGWNKNSFSFYQPATRMWRVLSPIESFANESLRCLNINDAFRLWEEYQSWMARSLQEIPPERILEIRYESLVAEPQDVVDQIVDHLKLNSSRRQRNAAAGHVHAPSEPKAPPELDAALIGESEWLRELGYL